jgi:arylsulfatase A-like enzyme
MKAIMVMFDSLNRHMLPPYGCDWIQAPNFARLAKQSVTFTNCYAGSLACMPARRDIHTGRYNFLHRSWGPLEPFDDSMPEILKKNDIHSHLVTDHHHYFEDGGATYHTKYSTWDYFRGQEGDPWKGEVTDPVVPECLGKDESHIKLNAHWRQDWINRKYIQDIEEFPQVKTFNQGLEFITMNRQAENWFLQLETFDPHEPFYSHEKYKQLYPHSYEGPHFDWPEYKRVDESKDQVEHCRLEYASLVSMCDEQLGRVLDKMDELDLWKDTMLIVNTDHGFLLGEHDWWAKMKPPLYNEVVHLPLFIWDPRCGVKGEERDALVQNIDLAPTILDYFGLEVPGDMTGKPLKHTIASNQRVRDAALFGTHGGHVNCTDGRYVYMRAPVSEFNEPLFNYTLMPTNMRGYFNIEELNSMEICEPLSFTKGHKVLKTKRQKAKNQFGTLLFDLTKDPGQKRPIIDKELENNMITLLEKNLQAHGAPAEQYERLGLNGVKTC